MTCCWRSALPALRVAALRRSRLLPIAGSATGALLVADAWFDVLTSSGGRDIAEAVAMSVLAELPLAFVCFWLAVHSQDVAEQRLLLLLKGRRDPATANGRVPSRTRDKDDDPLPAGDDTTDAGGRARQTEPESRSEPWTGAIGRLSLPPQSRSGRAVAADPSVRYTKDRSVLGPRVDRLLVDTEQQMSDHRPIRYAGWRLGSRAGDAGAAAGFSAAPREATVASGGDARALRRPHRERPGPASAIRARCCAGSSSSSELCRECPEIGASGNARCLDVPLPRSVLAHRFDAPEGGCYCTTRETNRCGYTSAR